jgi:hypothetical protein
MSGFLAARDGSWDYRSRELTTETQRYEQEELTTETQRHRENKRKQERRVFKNSVPLWSSLCLCG